MELHVYSIKKYNFGNHFIKWIQILYTNPVINIKNDGWLSEKITMTRGVRQGCPVSALLFILSTKIMNEKLRNDNKVEGFQINRTTQTLFAYADDTTLTLQNRQSITEALDSSLKK